MERYLGSYAKVSRIEQSDTSPTVYYIDIDNEEYGWAIEWLEHATSGEES